MSRVTHLLIHTVDVQRVGRVADGEGGFTESLSTAVSGIRARIGAPSSSDLNVASRDQTKLTDTMIFEFEDDVRHGDTIDWDGTGYEVLSVVRGSEPYFRKALLERIEAKQ